ncbi:FimD/PapC N-terminal domain-containing protein, partial [Pseudomonas syringae]|nr:FimD/PapC N-terminal domain-containing protein [Pseudomonas syringae]
MSFAMNRTSAEIKNVLWFIFLLSGCFISVRSFAVEFNVNFIDSADRNNVDLSRFQVADYIAPGEYLLDVVLNGRTFGEQSVIHYIPTADKKNSRLCLPPVLVDKFELTKDAREKLTLWHHGECTSLDQQQEVTARYDQEKQTLNISIPQAWL